MLHSKSNKHNDKFIELERRQKQQFIGLIGKHGENECIDQSKSWLL